VLFDFICTYHINNNSSHLTSNTTAWQHTLGIPGLMDMDPPFNDIKWGIAGGKNALSWPHIDASGFATTVVVTTGSKYWILLKESNEDAKRGNMGSPSAFENNWHPAEFQAGAYKYEAVHLTAGTTLSVFLLLFLLLL
jgi:hypothetical protein